MSPDPGKTRERESPDPGNLFGVRARIRAIRTVPPLSATPDRDHNGVGCAGPNATA